MFEGKRPGEAQRSRGGEESTEQRPQGLSHTEHTCPGLLPAGTVSLSGHHEIIPHDVIGIPFLTTAFWLHSIALFVLRALGP